MKEIVAAVEAAKRELEESPRDRVAAARARGVLSQAREAWETLDQEQRAALKGPAGELREAVDREAQDAGPPPEPEELLKRFGLGTFRPASARRWRPRSEGETAWW